MSKYVKRQHLIEILLSLVALNILWGNISFRPSVNLSCDYEVIFDDSQ